MAMFATWVWMLAFKLVSSNAPTYEEREQIALFSDLRSAFEPASDGSFENRVGFEFASMDISEYVHRTGELEPSLPGTRERLRNFASILLQHPGSHLHIDGHVGLSAPPVIAQDYSEARASLIAAEFECLGIPKERITTTGWGYTITRAAMTSNHPSADSAKSGYGWAELFIIFNDASSGKQVVMPPRPDYYANLPPEPTRAISGAAGRPKDSDKVTTRKTETSSKVATYPIFYLFPGTEVGEQVTLHFFEPRYKLLIRRAWDGDKRFIYCSDPPVSKASGESFCDLSFKSKAATNTCTLVMVDEVYFYEDGRADMLGHGMKNVGLESVSVEAGTGGLFTASTVEAEAASFQQPTHEDTTTSVGDIFELVMQVFPWLWRQFDIVLASLMQPQERREIVSLVVDSRLDTVKRPVYSVSEMLSKDAAAVAYLPALGILTFSVSALGVALMGYTCRRLRLDHDQGTTLSGPDPRPFIEV